MTGPVYSENRNFLDRKIVDTWAEALAYNLEFSSGTICPPSIRSTKSITRIELNSLFWTENSCIESTSFQSQNIIFYSTVDLPSLRIDHNVIVKNLPINHNIFLSKP